LNNLNDPNRFERSDRFERSERLERGYTLLELVFVTGVMVVIAAMAIPQAFASIERSRALAATRYLAGQLALARTQAVGRATTIALRFEVGNGGVAYSVFKDGNRNGVRTVDISAGIDRQIVAAAAVGDLFPRVTIVNGATDPPSPGVQLSGGSNLLSFTPSGTATAGSIYIRGADRSQYAIRVLGATGRTRLQRFDERHGEWVAIF
jgi:Tfp pilus assembly protein FimT